MSFAPGKIILSGEYAVLFGFPGVAVPSSLGMEATFEEDASLDQVAVKWTGVYGGEPWLLFTEKILLHCHTKRVKLRGRLHIHAGLPLGKGMGSSTAIVIAIARAIFGEDCRSEALLIEDIVNPGHSGFDFAVIWGDTSVRFVQGQEPEQVDLPPGLLRGGVLIDTGQPNESTPEMVEWMMGKKEEVQRALETIGCCSEALIAGENIVKIFHEHHRAQQDLGVVTKETTNLIETIERAGGAAKVIGAGGRTGGSGMVLALGVDPDQIQAFSESQDMPSSRF